MRVLIVNAAPFTGGAEAWILQLVRALAPRGQAIELAHHPRSELGDRALEAGASAAWVPLSGMRGVARTAAALAREVRRRGYDVVVSTTRSDLVPAGIAARLAGLPGVVARLNSGMAQGAPIVNAGWRWRRHRWYHRNLVHRAVTNSRAGAADLVARDFLSPDRIDVIHNGIDLERFDPARVTRGRFRADLGISATAPLVTSIARYAPGRGREAEVEAAARLTAARPDLHVAFIGSCRREDEPFRARLGRLARVAHGAHGGRIHILGPRQDMPEVLADSDVLMRVLSTEGLANVALEAMAMGVPVVAADISGMPEAVLEGETGRLVPPGDAAAIAAVVADVLDLPPERRAAMAQKARAHLRARFSLAHMADRYEALFTRAVDPGA